MCQSCVLQAIKSQMNRSKDLVRLFTSSSTLPSSHSTIQHTFQHSGCSSECFSECFLECLSGCFSASLSVPLEFKWFEIWIQNFWHTKHTTVCQLKTPKTVSHHSQPQSACYSPYVTVCIFQPMLLLAYYSRRYCLSKLFRRMKALEIQILE